MCYDLSSYMMSQRLFERPELGGGKKMTRPRYHALISRGYSPPKTGEDVQVRRENATTEPIATFAAVQLAMKHAGKHSGGIFPYAKNSPKLCSPLSKADLWHP